MVRNRLAGSEDSRETGSNQSSGGGDETAEAFGVEGHMGDSASMQAVTSFQNVRTS